MRPSTVQTAESKSTEQSQSSALDTLQAIKHLATQNAALFADKNEHTQLKLLGADSQGVTLRIDLKTGELSLREAALFGPAKTTPVDTSNLAQVVSRFAPAEAIKDLREVKSFLEQEIKREQQIATLARDMLSLGTNEYFKRAVALAKQTGVLMREIDLGQGLKLNSEGKIVGPSMFGKALEFDQKSLEGFLRTSIPRSKNKELGNLQQTIKGALDSWIGSIHAELEIRAEANKAAQALFAKKPKSDVTIIADAKGPELYYDAQRGGFVGAKGQLFIGQSPRILTQDDVATRLANYKRNNPEADLAELVATL
jgi:hypothetical protein